MRYEFHPDALGELREAAQYYAIREVGLDLRFVDSVEETIGRILEAPIAGGLSRRMCAAV